MLIVLGATGHVGSTVADELLRAGEEVTVVTRDERKAATWRGHGAVAALVDVTDTDALREVFRRGRRAFLLNPPAPTSTDTDREEHRSFEAIVRALDGSGLEKVVAQSAYGAQPGDRIGDLSVLYDFEQALARQSIPVTVLRGAYYMSNWDPLLDAARGGVLPTMHPADLVIPMVAPADVGKVAARMLREPAERTGIRYVEGPDRYTPQDVAGTFARVLGREVQVAVTPRNQWEEAYRELGFSEPAAAAYARMIAVSVDGAYDLPSDPERGRTTLDRYVEALVQKA